MFAAREPGEHSEIVARSMPPSSQALKALSGHIGPRRKRCVRRGPLFVAKLPQPAIPRAVFGYDSPGGPISAVAIVFTLQNQTNS